MTRLKKWLVFNFASMTVIGCSHNAITGRNQLSVYPESEIQHMASEQYKIFLSSNKIVVKSSENKDVEMLQRVGERLSDAISIYYSQQGMSKELEGFKWEFNLVDSKQVNAWCMPGGKIAVYTGLLSITQNETCLGIILGHQITHALARHGNERMDQAMIQQLGGVALSVADENQPTETQSLFMNAYGIGSHGDALLPFSRKQEYEADRLGLRFAALAGYNPAEAIALWERLKASSGRKHSIDMLKIHPVDDKRIEKLKEEMPNALSYYKSRVANQAN